MSLQRARELLAEHDAAVERDSAEVRQNYAAGYMLSGADILQRQETLRAACRRILVEAQLEIAAAMLEPVRCRACNGTGHAPRIGVCEGCRGAGVHFPPPVSIAVAGG